MPVRRSLRSRFFNVDRLTQRLGLEQLENRTLPSVSFIFNPGTGKNDVTFDYTSSGSNDLLVLRQGSGGNLEYSFNGSAFSNDLDTGKSGSQFLPLSGISKITVSLDGGNDTLTLNTGAVIPSPNGIAYLGGAGVDCLTITQDTDFTLTNTSLVLSPGGTVQINSVEQADITGGNGPNKIDASAFTLGSATLRGGNQTDLLLGGSGDDSIDGGAGNDLLNGGTGNDTLNSTNSGSSSLFGGPGNDVLLGGNGQDDLHGGAGNDTLTGNNGTDQLFGDEGDDQLEGGNGNDALGGGPGSDAAVATGDFDFTVTDSQLRGLGTDTLTSIERAIITGGEKDNTVDASNFTGTVTIDGGNGNDKLVGATNGINFIVGGLGSDDMTGGDGDDIMFGGTRSGPTDEDLGSDTMVGGLGDDRLDGGGGDDIMFGGTRGGAGDEDLGGADTLIGGLGNDRLDGGSGDDIMFGGTRGGTTEEDLGGADTLIGGLGNDRLDGGSGDDIMFGGTRGGIDDEDLGTNTMIGGLGSDRLEGGSGVDIMFGGTFPGGNVTAFESDFLFGWNGPDLLGSGGGDDYLDGGAGNDEYVFIGANLGIDSLVEAPGVDSDTLDFSGFGAAITLDLAVVGSQVVNPGNLTLSLSNSTSIENVIGSRFADTIDGNSRANVLHGANQFDDRYGTAPPWNLVTQVVFLDFDTYTADREHVYTGTERDQIQAQLEADYAEFHVDFTQSMPSGDFATINFNRTPIVNGQEEFGGLASELDFRNVNPGGDASIDVNGLLGGIYQPAATTENFVALSATIGAHELGHLLGLRHLDSAGPIGTGLPKPVDPDQFIPPFPGPRDAFETFLHLMASPASVGESLGDATTDQFFGEREAVKLAFDNSGTTISEQGTPHNSRETAQAINLNNLTVPNTLLAGLHWGLDFAVGATAVIGSVELAEGFSEDDYYSFSGRTGDVMTFEIYSESMVRIANPIDSILRLYDSHGNLVPYFSSVAENDDQFEGKDAILLDVILPADDTYYIQLDTFTSETIPDIDTGDYELFMYRYAAGNATDLGDIIDGRENNDTVSGGLGANVLKGGDGADTVTDNGNVSFSLSDVALNGTGSNSLNGFENAVLVGGDSANSFAVNGWTGTATINGRFGNDTIVGANTPNNWGLPQNNAGSINSLIGFSSIESLVGGTVSDQFVFANNVVVSVGVDGAGGNDTLNYSAMLSNLTWNISGADAGNVNGMSFTRMENLLGGTAADNFVVAAGVSPAMTVNGGAGNDTFNFAATTTNLTWNLPASNAGTVGGASFSAIENLTSGSGDDDVLLANGAGATGAFQAGAGRNWLDYSAYTSGINVSLLGGVATGFGSALGFRNIVGGGGADTITGDANNNIFVGNGGNDSLNGGDGRDILIGGMDADSLDGGADDDILIGARTSHDGNRANLLALMLEWSRTDLGYTARLNHLTGSVSDGFNGSVFLNGSSLLSDNKAVDTLFGRAGTDWFITDNKDSIMDKVSGETNTKI